MMSKNNSPPYPPRDSPMRNSPARPPRPSDSAIGRACERAHVRIVSPASEQRARQSVRSSRSDVKSAHSQATSYKSVRSSDSRRSSGSERSRRSSDSRQSSGSGRSRRSTSSHGSLFDIDGRSGVPIPDADRSAITTSTHRPGPARTVRTVRSIPPTVHETLSNVPSDCSEMIEQRRSRQSHRSSHGVSRPTPQDLSGRTESARASQASYRKAYLQSVRSGMSEAAAHDTASAQSCPTQLHYPARSSRTSMRSARSSTSARSAMSRVEGKYYSDWKKIASKIYRLPEGHPYISRGFTYLWSGHGECDSMVRGEYITPEIDPWNPSNMKIVRKAPEQAVVPHRHSRGNFRHRSREGAPVHIRVHTNGKGVNTVQEMSANRLHFRQSTDVGHVSICAE